MKKVMLSFAVIGALMVVSCEKKADEKVVSETEKIADTLEKEADTAATKIEATIEETGDA